MIYAVALSSGVSSAIAAQRALDRWGDAVHLVFCDTMWEDDDNYRFLSDLRGRWGIPITVLQDGRNPLQVAQDAQIIPSARIAPCTSVLKIKLFVDHLDALRAKHGPVAVVLGINWSEPHRMEAPRRNYEARGYPVEFPLMWKPYDFYPLDTVRKWGIEPPRMYAQGYSHANCGGRCVKQGFEDWARTAYFYPDRYDEVSAWEQEIRRDPRFADHAIQRSRVGGVSVPITLEELRQRSRVSPLQLNLPTLEDGMCLCNAADPGMLIDKPPKTS